MAHHHGGGSSGMDMGGMDMGGMSMSSGSFKPEAFRITKIYWYLICAVIAIMTCANVYNIVNARLRKEEARANPDSRPAMPRNQLTQSYATLQTMYREMSYPQGIYWSKKGLAWLSPPSVGRVVVLLIYWITISIMLTVNAVHHDAYYYERLGFRAAWISIMQLPLIIVLSTKINILGILIGSSYEKLNWLHRWVSRTLWVCITIHGASFLREWVIADFLSYELEVLPMVKYGMGAWGVLTWMIISGLVPIRAFAYEIFVIQHLVSAALFLWLVYVHAPEYAWFYIWIAIGFLAFDRVARWAWFAFRNVNIFRSRGVVTRLADRVGYRAELQVVPGDTTRVTIKNVPFNWKAGQHVFVGIPRLGFFEAHPFTISNTCKTDGDSSFNTATLAVRAHGGFSKRLLNYAAKHTGVNGSPAEVRAFIQGPYGSYPTWNAYDTVVLISASTGCSFTLPILEDILHDPACVKHVTFMLLVRSAPQCSCYMQRLRDAAALAAKTGLLVRIQVVVTGQAMEEVGEHGGEMASQCVCGPDTPAESCCCGGGHNTEGGKIEGVTTTTGPTADEEALIGTVRGSCCATKTVSDSEDKDSIDAASSKGSENESTVPANAEKAALQARERALPITTVEASLSPPKDNLHHSFRLSRLSTLYVPSITASTYEKPYVDFASPGSRPDLASHIRYPVESALGETLVVCCGGRELTGTVRNAVAALSDERGVHKGTGALGIQLYVEEFGY